MKETGRRPRKPLSEEHRKKLSEVAIRDFANGRQPWNLGKHISEEHRRKISEARMGMVLSEEHRRHIAESIPEERRHLLSEAMKAFHHPQKEKSKPHKRSNWARGWIS